MNQDAVTTSTEDVIKQLVEKNIFNQAEVIALLRSVFASDASQVQPFVDAVYKWAEDIRTQSKLLQMILDGLLLVTFDANGQMVATLSELGRDINKVLHPSDIPSA